jgi:polysaccharide chain length determinant protein (PEP-CTERM system associated)
MEEVSGLKLQDYWFILLRRKWLLIIPALLGLLGGWIALRYFLPKAYQASALIMVEPPAVSSNVIRPLEGGTSEAWVRLFQEEFMSRKFLEPILRELNLYGVSQVGDEGIEDVVEYFRNHIEVESSKVGSGSNRDIISFRVSFEGPNPKTVMDVTNRLANLFIESHQKTVSVQVQGTSSFLETELNNLRNTLEKQEAAIAEFRRQHMGALPEQLTSNLASKEKANQELKVVNESLETAMAKKTALNKLMNETKEGDTISSRLAELRRQLSDLMTRYKETYPDVIMTKQQIGQLEALQRDGLASPEDPAILAGREGGGLQKQLGELNFTIDSLKRKHKDLESQIGEYDQRITETPRREQEMMILMRDYDNLKKNYQVLLDKRLNNTLSENVQSEDPGGRLRIIDPAYLPAKPFRPDPLRVMLMSLVIGVGCGAGIVLLLEYSDASFRKPEDVERALGLPVLAAIPMFPAKEIATIIRKQESVLK